MCLTASPALLLLTVGPTNLRHKNFGWLEVRRNIRDVYIGWVAGDGLVEGYF